MTHRKGPQYIYFIRALDAVKIGFSQVPHERFQQLQWKVPTRLVLLGYVRGGRREESLFKKEFASMKLYGEWHIFTGPLREFVYDTLKRNRFSSRALKARGKS